MVIEVAKPTREERMLEAEENSNRLKQEWQDLLALDLDLLDDDGYPTDHALDIIERWHWSDSKGWFEFIKSIWWAADWGWKECDAIDDVSGKKSYCYYISTGGWSGNESIIRAMEKNWLLWNTQWVQSRRGGHYIFELKEY